jgi:uncharacterized membrane protein YccC
LSERLKGFLKLLWLSGRQSLRRDVFHHAMAVGIASAFGLALGLVFGLPRDYWIIVTLIIAVRPNIRATVIAAPPHVGSTVTFASMRVMGTVVGAVIASAITFTTNNMYVLGGLLFAFAVCVFATRGVNPVLVQVFPVPLVVILLNLLDPGQWQLGGFRILDVIIGGVIAIATVYLLGIRSRARGLAA